MDTGVHPNRPSRPDPIRQWGGLFALLVGGMVGGAFLPGAYAQPDTLRLIPMSPAAQANGGIQLVRAGQPADALPLLKEAVAARPAYVHRDQGSAAYWLGEAYARTDSAAQARTAWRRGVDALARADRFDPRLADAYLRTLTPSELRGERLPAVDFYVRLLERVGTDTSSALRPIYRRRMAQLAPLLPDDVFARVIEGDRAEEPSTWTFRPGAGDTLRAWWRGLDPFPATEENERLEEHVTRLVRARQSFACPERPSALDDRGIIHLRLGAPQKQRPLRYKNMEFFREVFRFGVPIPPNAFPESEIWLYPQIDESAYYLFAESGTSDCYEIARANDLLPNTLTRRRNNSERGLNIAYSSLMAMRAIYGELALYHMDYSGRYTEIANYADYQEMRATAAALTGGPAGAEQQATVGSGVGQTRTVTSNPNLGIQAPSNFVGRMVSRAEREDEQAAERRKENTPAQYTALHEGTPELPVAVRTARFLTADGATRTEVYWGVSATNARLTIDEQGGAPVPSMIRFSAARYNGDRSQIERQNQRVQLSAHPTRRGPAAVPDPVTFEGGSLHHLSMQWTQYQLRPVDDSAVVGPGPKRRFALVRADSLQPLRAEGALEMSDLKVLSLPDTALKAVANPLEEATPFPFRTLTPETPLLLAFEAYHLTYGPEDRTDYRVSYTVEGETRQGWTRLLRRPDTRQTSTAINRSGTARRTDEVILLDLSEIAREKTQDARVTVRVTDEHTGTTASRSLDFVLRPIGGS